MGAEKQHIEGGGHAFRLLGQRRNVRCKAKLGMAAATGLGEKPHELLQTRDADGVRDLPALPGGLCEARAFERGEMKRKGRVRHVELRGKIAGRGTDRPRRQQQAQKLEPLFLGKGAERRRRFASIHHSIIPEFPLSPSS